MGINFSFCDANWSYGGFHEARVKLAKEIDIDLDSMEGFIPLRYASNGIVVSWDTVNDDIKMFLNHSDCGGYLTPIQCKKIIPRLKELIYSWESYDYDKIHFLKLIEGMEKSVQLKKRLRFE